MKKIEKAIDLINTVIATLTEKDTERYHSTCLYLFQSNSGDMASYLSDAVSKASDLEWFYQSQTLIDAVSNSLILWIHILRPSELIQLNKALQCLLWARYPDQRTKFCQDDAIRKGMEDLVIKCLHLQPGLKFSYGQKYEQVFDMSCQCDRVKTFSAPYNDDLSLFYGAEFYPANNVRMVEYILKKYILPRKPSNNVISALYDASVVLFLNGNIDDATTLASLIGGKKRVAICSGCASDVVEHVLHLWEDIASHDPRDYYYPSNRYKMFEDVVNIYECLVILGCSEPINLSVWAKNRLIKIVNLSISTIIEESINIYDDDNYIVGVDYLRYNPIGRYVFKKYGKAFWKDEFRELLKILNFLGFNQKEIDDFCLQMGGFFFHCGPLYSINEIDEFDNWGDRYFYPSHRK